jgi:DNA primase
MDLLYQSLLKQNHLALDMAEVGLIRLKENYYDVFRKRIMFPITD